MDKKTIFETGEKSEQNKPLERQHSGNQSIQIFTADDEWKTLNSETDSNQLIKNKLKDERVYPGIGNAQKMSEGEILKENKKNELIILWLVKINRQILMEQEIYVTDLSQQIGCYDNLYWKICQLGYILSPLRSCKQAYSIKKLLDIGNEKIYSPHVDDIDTEVRSVCKLTSSKIYDEIFQFKTANELQLNLFHLPPKDFLLKMLYSLKKDHTFFKNGIIALIKCLKKRNHKNQQENDKKYKEIEEIKQVCNIRQKEIDDLKEVKEKMQKQIDDMKEVNKVIQNENKDLKNKIKYTIHNLLVNINQYMKVDIYKLNSRISRVEERRYIEQPQQQSFYSYQKGK